MKRYLVAVREDAPSYWSAMFSDGSFEQLDATYYSEAQEEADLRLVWQDYNMLKWRKTSVDK